MIFFPGQEMDFLAQLDQAAQDACEAAQAVQAHR